MPLPGVIALDAVRLALAGVELPDRQEHVVDRAAVGAAEPRSPTLQPLDQPLASGLVTTAAFPVPQLPGSTIPSLPDPELLGLFFR